MNFKKSNLDLCLDWHEYWHVHASGHLGTILETQIESYKTFSRLLHKQLKVI